MKVTGQLQNHNRPHNLNITLKNVSVYARPFLDGAERRNFLSSLESLHQTLHREHVILQKGSSRILGRVVILRRDQTLQV